MTSIKHHLLSAAFAILSFGFGMLVFAAPTHATAPSDFVFTINGGESATIINGQDVTLGWYVNVEGVTNCTINNGVGSIDVSSLPASGSMVVTPPEDTSTNYAMNCDGAVSTVTVDITPVVTMTLSQGDTRTNSALTQNLSRTDVAWSSQFATRCGNMWYETQSGATYTANHSNEYRNKNQPAGWLRFRGWPHPNIDETTTFFIKCYNDENGSFAIGQVTLTVIDPPPPPLPVVNIWTPDSDATVQRDDLSGYATADVRFNSTGVTWCTYQAYYQDGITPYENLPRGFGQWGGHTGASFRDVKIATTTVFEVTCSRSSVDYASTTYPATSTSDRIRIGVATGTEMTERTELPPVTALINGFPNPAEKHPITNSALIQASTSVREADYCYRYAYEWDGDSYDDQYRLGGWTKDKSWDRASGNADENQVFYLDRSTRLEVYCLREYDIDFGNASETENGTERVSLVIEVEPPSEVLPPPIAYMYGEAVVYDAQDIWDDQTSVNGFIRTSDRLETAPEVASNTITFAFDHPRDSSDTYNIHFEHCDENDGVNYFRFYHEGSIIGSWTTDRTQVQTNDCDNDSDFVATIAKGITVAEGDEITVECDSDYGERCRFHHLFFGVGSGDGDSLAPPVSSSTGLVETKLMWMSDYATWCDSTPDDNMAITDGGNIYQWYYGNSIWGTMDRSISTSTTFYMECYRYDPDFSIPRDESGVRIALPNSISLTSSTSVATGDCIDPDTLQPIDTPEGYQANPDTGLCEPAVDLGAVSPAVSVVSAVTDNVAGTYDNVEALVAIHNFGPGALSAGSEISYMANMTFAPVYGLPVLDTSVGYFNDPISAPADSSSPTISPTLSRIFDNVPFGNHQVCTRVNLDGAPNYPESNPDPSNNTVCGNVSLPVPPPPMVFTATPEVLRRGESAELYFEIDVTYQMSCTVRGAGGIDETFDTLVGPATAAAAGANNMASLGNLIAQAPLNSGSITTDPLESTSKFIFQCTEPITNTTFTEEVTVEVLPTTQEF